MGNDLMNMMLSIIAAVVSGVFVFFLGEMWKERCLDPIREFKVLRRKIESTLFFYANKYTVLKDKNSLNKNDYEIYLEVSRELRALASELVSSSSQMPIFRQRLPKNDEILEAAIKLVRLSNNVPCIEQEDRNMCQENRVYEEEIFRILKIKAKIIK